MVDEVLDLRRILADHRKSAATRPAARRLLVRLLIYGCATGVRSSRAIERRLADDVAFRFLAVGQEPDVRSLARLRRRRSMGSPIRSSLGRDHRRHGGTARGVEVTRVKVK